MSHQYQRVVVVGSSGSGKSTLARTLRDRFGHSWLELDAVQHLEGWQTRPADESAALIRDFVHREQRWVIDGNYAHFRDLIWPRADTVVWLDLPRLTVLRSLVARTLRRLLTREELWNGNRERWTNLCSLDPEESVIAWSMTHFERYRQEYAALMEGPEWPHLHWERLESRAATERWLQHLARRLA